VGEPGLDIFEPVATVVPVRQVSGAAGRRRGRTAIAFWALGLIAIVGVAIAGRAGDADTTSRTAAIVFASPTHRGSPDPTVAPFPAPELIVLGSPAEAGMTITTRELVVQGFVQSAAVTVRVTLEARGNRVIDGATIRPALAFAERPSTGRHPQFQVQFGLPNPRPNGRMIVQVAAYDREGRILDVIRRPIRVGPLLEGLGT
jgi:hypothetical protein